ncbi:MAG: hypothetical protein RMM17_06340 [Acidobacteriota bacterium]|nr:hypothetical protein [Blastocatellia bacterium]MDW8412282.1 hypothetical protein [Acidobacteriota bacterium]
MLFALMLSLVWIEVPSQELPFEVSKIACSNSLAADSTSPGWSAVPIGLAQNRWTMEFKLLNRSDKQITALHWAFRFRDKSGKTVVQEFKSKRNIKPGKDSIIKETFIFDAASMPSPITGTILLRQVDFSDGSTWLPDPSDPDSGTVLVKP